MTRLWIQSDLHLESEHNLLPADRYWPRTLLSHDVVVLAGDVHESCARAVRWADDAFLKPVVMVAGNHEFYGGRLDLGLSAGKRAAGETSGGVTLLENGVYRRRDLRILGCTLWSDFDLHPDRERNFANAARGSQDFHLITGFTPSDARDRHLASLSWLVEELRRPHDGPTVVVTHHAPSRMSIDERFEGDPLSPSFASDLEWVIDEFQPALWIHGHVHDQLDYMIGKTRIVCNPKGYRTENPSFRTDLIVEV